MKKSKEYFSEIKEVVNGDCPDKVAEKVTDIFREIINVEISELAGMRNVSTDPGIIAIIEELNKKWNSICDKCETIGIDWLIRDAVKKTTDKVLSEGKNENT